MLNILDETAVRCPFCRVSLSEENVRTYGNITYFEGGRCQCGSVFVYDQTGHNLGQAFEDALVFACEGDFDKAFSLVPDEDYKQHVVGTSENHRSTRRIVRYQQRGRTKKTGLYYFIKLLNFSDQD